MKSFLQNYYYEVKKEKKYEVITSQKSLNFFFKKNTKTSLHKFQKNKLLRSLQGGTLGLVL